MWEEERKVDYLTPAMSLLYEYFIVQSSVIDVSN